jgi:hypothetical protein
MRPRNAIEMGQLHEIASAGCGGQGESKAVARDEWGDRLADKWLRLSLGMGTMCADSGRRQARNAAAGRRKGAAVGQVRATAAGEPG